MHQFFLDSGDNHVIQTLDLPPEFAESEDFTCRRVGTGGFCRVCACEFIHPQRNPWTHTIDHAVCDVCGDDLPTQAVIRHETLKAWAQCRREITL